MKCPSCGAVGDGRFCSQCGAPLGDASCTRCSAPLLPGARFCTQCGAAARASSLGGNTGWYVAAGILLVMIAIVAIMSQRNPPDVAVDPPFDSGSAVRMGEVTGAGNGGGSPPPLTGTPREQADRLFNRIMEERESGDTAQARFFLPMAIDAYRNVGDLEGDGMYHLMLLQTSAGRTADAIATAERLLSTNPTHLLALGAAGEAADVGGDREAAVKYYTRFLQAYAAERTKSLAEYLDHAKMLPEYEAAAKRVTGR